MSLNRSVGGIIALLVFAGPLAGQSNATTTGITRDTVVVVDSNTSSVSAVPTSAGPTRANTAFGVRAMAAKPAPVPAPVPAATSRNMAMMLVGGAALIVGAVVDGDAGTILMVGGGVVGLWGLWNYLQ